MTPHHLLLTHEALLGYDTACKVNPPLREQEDVDALRRALADGTIDCIATDHAPHGVLDKNVELAEAAPGMIGLELCLPLLLGLVRQGALPLARLVDALTRGAGAHRRPRDAAHPRRARGRTSSSSTRGRAGRIDPARLKTKSRNTPFAGQSVEGRVEMTMCEGRIVHEEVTDA